MTFETYFIILLISSIFLGFGCLFSIVFAANTMLDHRVDTLVKLFTVMVAAAALVLELQTVYGAALADQLRAVYGPDATFGNTDISNFEELLEEYQEQQRALENIKENLINERTSDESS